MNDLQKSVLAGFSAVWETVVDLPLKCKCASNRPPEWSAVFFPLLGVLSGEAVLIAGVLGRWLFNPLAGAVIFALLGSALWELRDSGRGSRLLASFLGERFRGTAWQEALENASAAPDGIRLQPSAPIYWIGLVARFLLLLALGRAGAESWLIVVWVCGFSLQGMLALEPSAPGEPALFPGGEKGKRCILWTTGAIGVCLYLRFPAGVLAAGILFYFACRKGRTLLLQNPDSVNDGITLAAAGAEHLWLLLGLLLAL